MRRSATFAAILAAGAVLAAASPAAAMYHPTLGRWVQRDPTGYRDGASLVQYCRTTPVGRADPSGRTTIIPWVGDGPSLSVGGKPTEFQCRHEIAALVNQLIRLAVSKSSILKYMGREAPDAGRLAEIGKDVDKWTMEIEHRPGLIYAAYELIAYLRGSTAITPNPIWWPLAPPSVLTKLYTDLPDGRCRSLNSILHTNVEEAIHQNNYNSSNPERLKTPRTWNPDYGATSDVSNYASHFTRDVEMVLGLTGQEVLDHALTEEERRKFCTCCHYILNIAQEAVKRISAQIEAVGPIKSQIERIKNWPVAM
ncbi:MAG: hypothetical protein FJ288_08725 [Planctomycetes bacterium]|nr:hypothetical protein [Planctomycetota bacterium]